MRIAFAGNPNSDVNRKKGTMIDVAALSAALGCPVVETVSTVRGDKGLAEVVKAAVTLKGRTQKAPYSQGDIDLSSKAAVEEADRSRFAFVNRVVAGVERRKVLTRERNAQDRIASSLCLPGRSLTMRRGSAHSCISWASPSPSSARCW